MFQVDPFKGFVEAKASATYQYIEPGFDGDLEITMLGCITTRKQEIATVFQFRVRTSNHPAMPIGCIVDYMQMMKYEQSIGRVKALTCLALGAPDDNPEAAAYVMARVYEALNSNRANAFIGRVIHAKAFAKAKKEKPREFITAINFTAATGQAGVPVNPALMQRATPDDGEANREVAPAYAPPQGPPQGAWAPPGPPAGSWTPPGMAGPPMAAPQGPPQGAWAPPGPPAGSWTPPGQ